MLPKDSVTSKKSPNVYKKLPKKWKIYIDTFTKYA